MPRLATQASEVRNLVLLDTRSFQSVTSGIIQIGCQVLVRDEVGVVPCTAGEEFSTEPGVFIHLQHINADMGQAGIDRRRQRNFPARGALVGQPGNEVDAQIRQSSVAEASDIIFNGFPLVQAPHRSGFPVHEGLHPQAHAIDAATQQGFNHRRGQSAWGTFDGRFRARQDAKILRNCDK